MTSRSDALIAADFPSFARACHKVLRNGKTLDDDPYLDIAFSAAEDVANGKTTKITISMPPGTAKTFIFSIALVAWVLAKDPSLAILVTTHNDKQATDITRSIRKILESDMFERIFRTRIDPDWRGAGDFGTTRGGSVYATGIAGGITGYRADVTIVDDPLAIKHANNRKRRELVNETFDDEIFSRARDEDSRFVVVMHRLHPDDLIGHLARRRGFTKLVLPLIADKKQTYRSRYGSWCREKSEQLRPGRFTKHELRDLAFKANFRWLYQQGRGGAESWRIKTRFFPMLDGIRNESLPVVFSIDTAQKASANSSRMVIQVWQTDGRRHDLLHVFAENCDYERLWNQLEVLIRRFPPSMVLIEDTSSGSALLSQASARLKCLSRGVSPKGTKSERLRRHFKTLRAQRVRVPLFGDWITDWIEEITAFPEGEFDDNVDALSMFLDYMAGKPKLAARERSRGGLFAMVNSRGQQMSSGRIPGGTTRGHIAIAQTPRLLQPSPTPAFNGRASLDIERPIYVETRLGPVIIRR